MTKDQISEALRKVGGLCRWGQGRDVCGEVAA